MGKGLPLTQDGALDLLVHDKTTEELSRLEGEGLVALLVHTRRRNESQGKGSLHRRVRWVDEDQRVAAEHRLDGGKEVFGHVGRIGIANRRCRGRSRFGVAEELKGICLVSVS
jgi:hypothetical protein